MSGSDREVSVPPSPPPPAPTRAPAGSIAGVEPPEIDESLAATSWRVKRALSILRTEIRARLLALEEAVGRDPDPKVKDDEGEGLLGRVSTVELVVGAPPDPVRKRDASGMIAIMLSLQATLEGFKKELADDREAKQQIATAEVKRAEFRSKLAWGIGLPVAVTIVLGLLAIAWKFVSTLHH